MIKSAFWKDCSNCAEGKGSRVGSRVGQWLNMVSQEAMAAVRLNVLNLGDITFSNPDAQDSPRPVETRISWWERMVPGISNWNLPHPAPRIFHCAAKFRKQWFWQVMIAGSSRELDGFARSLVGDYFVNNSQAGERLVCKRPGRGHKSEHWERTQQALTQAFVWTKKLTPCRSLWGKGFSRIRWTVNCYRGVGFFSLDRLTGLCDQILRAGLMSWLALICMSCWVLISF